MSVIVKGDSPFDAFIVSGIKGCHTEHIKFYNISFNCKTIEDADGRVFTRCEERKNGKWIPCSEKLPEVRQWVLCQCRAGIMDVLRLTVDGSWNKDYLHAEYMGGFVIAWMPLPEPYEGGNDV